MKKNFFNALTLVVLMLVCSVTFSSCSDDDLVDIQAEVVLPSDANLMELEAWSYVVPLDIKSNSEWRIEKNGDFFDVIPSEGEGNATIEIHVTDNIYEERQNGELRIVFPNDESKNMVLKLQQKWEGDYDENDNATATVGPKKYAIGYGYNVTEKYASSASVKGQIFMMNNLYNDALVACDSSEMNYSLQTITGSTVSEISNKLAANVNVTGKYGKFQGEVKSSFTADYAESSNYEYAITYLNIAKQTYSFEMDPYEIASKYMTTAAYNAINGKSYNFATNNPEGFRNLIQHYGTHVVLEARLGGRIRYSMEINISNIETEYDLEAFASAAYDGLFVQADANVKNNFKDSYKKNKNQITTRLDVIGGVDSTKNGLTIEFTKQKIDAWKSSLNSKNLGLIAFTDNGSLLPLYELVNRDSFPERYEALKDYMEGEAMANDFSEYQCGTYTKFNIPTFSEKGTLVKDIKLGGEHVGQICEEYIPQINKDSRVIVVYPVINGKMRMNMGFFIGDKYHKPARVSWNGDKVTIAEHPELNFGSAKTLYLRGASIRATANESVSIMEGNVEDCYLLGNVADINYSKRQVKAKEHKYPLVKIFNHIWTREDYTSPLYDTGNGLSIGYDGNRQDAYVSSNSNIYVRAATATNASYAPSGWDIADSKAYNTIKSTLTANNINLPGKTLLEGGLLGYNAKFIGWVDMFFWNKEGVVRGGDEQMEYLTSDNYHIRLKKDGTFDVDGGVNQGDWYMRVRLIKE